MKMDSLVKPGNNARGQVVALSFLPASS